ncbi:S1 RNA-binding domain-containing protein 1 isoform X2 [Rhodnius prolixus]
MEIKSVKRPFEGKEEKCLKSAKFSTDKGQSKGTVKKNVEKAKAAHSSKLNSQVIITESSSSHFVKYPPWMAQVAKQAGISVELCSTIINLFEDEHTIPFLVRYRSNKIQGKSADELRIIKDVYKTMKQVHSRASFIKKTLASKNVLSEDLVFHIDNAQSLAELEELYEPFKSTKKSKIQQAEELGIVQVVKNVLERRSTLIKLDDIVNPVHEITKDSKTVKQLLSIVSADIMLKDVEFISKVTVMSLMHDVYIESKKHTTSTRKEKPPRTNSASDKFKNYYNFQKSYTAIKPHQVLAINRGEEQHELKVSVELPARLHKQMESFLWNKWVNKLNKNNFLFDILNNAIQTIVIVKTKKKIIRRIRAELTCKAEKASLNVFSSNLKWLLLTQPVTNQTVLAIDPGFVEGCKIAVVSPEQKVLDTALCYLSNSYFTSHLTALIRKYHVSLVAIGNGKGCRETEKRVGLLLKNLTEQGVIVPYTIVSEQGVSIYSCSEEAVKEYPDLSPKMIGAVSLAKRVIDPLGEMIKVSPKHLGVGMYQHDLNPKRLEEMLNEVVSEVVSMVGVNLNTAPVRLLMNVAGLTKTRAQALINYRETNGPFKRRSQITQVKGVGKKSFEQCAGFVRILPQGADGDDIEEPLDQTIIHPEEYATASRFIEEICVLSKKDIGREDFIRGVKRSTELGGKLNICRQLNISECCFDVIFEGLTQTLHYDIRMEFAEQLFRKEVRSFEQLEKGQIITGRVENVTHFGSFIDIGVENTMLLPTSNTANENSLHYGQKVLVKVGDIDNDSQKVSLLLVKILSK